MSASFPVQGAGLLFPVSTAAMSAFQAPLSLIPGYHSHFTSEQMGTQKGDTNAQVQGQDAP